MTHGVGLLPGVDDGLAKRLSMRGTKSRRDTGHGLPIPPSAGDGTGINNAPGRRGRAHRRGSAKAARCGLPARIAPRASGALKDAGTRHAAGPCGHSGASAQAAATPCQSKSVLASAAVSRLGIRVAGVVACPGLAGGIVSVAAPAHPGPTPWCVLGRGRLPAASSRTTWRAEWAPTGMTMPLPSR